MEVAATPTRISRVDLRFRPRAHHVPANERREVDGKDSAREALDQKRNDPPTMGNDHRAFHRRAAQADVQIVTVAVEVVATVDTNGNVLGQATKVAQDLPLPTEAVVAVPSIASVAAEIIPSVAAEIVPSVAAAVVPSVAAEVVPSLATAIVPSVAAVPTLPSLQVLPSTVQQVVPSVSAAQSVASAVVQAVPSVVKVADVPVVPSVPPAPTPVLPSVPSVPPFPSTLVVPSVPAYPWPSGVPVAEAAAVTNTISSTPVSTNVVGSSAVPTSTHVVNVPLSSIIPSTATPFPVSSISSQDTPLPSSIFESSDSPSKSSASIVSGSAKASDAAATTYYVAPGVPGNPGAPPAATTAAIADTNAKSTPPPLQTPQVVGSVVGSLAGAALILAIVLMLLRRHKRRRTGALQLTGDDHSDADQQPMRQAPVQTSLVPAAFLNRFSGMSRSTIDTNTSGGERSFQRVSGRKLPSAFSEGMTSEQFSRGGTISGSSFYQDDHGVYGGRGLSKELGSPDFSKEFGKEIGDTSSYRTSGPMNFRPSPARTPIIRHPDDDPPFGTNRTHLSPPQSPNADFAPRGTLGRSLPSADGSRSSRFTENV